MPVIQKKKEKKPNAAKMYLLQLRYINDQIDQERQEMERLTLMLRDIQGINYDWVQVTKRDEPVKSLLLSSGMSTRIIARTRLPRSMMLPEQMT